MGEVTFSEFKNYLKFELGERTDLSSWGDLGNLYGKWINLSYLTISTSTNIPGIKNQLYFPELHTNDATQSTADGTKTLNTPSDAIYVEGIWDTTNDVELRNISWPEYKERSGRSNADARAKPTEWTRRGSYLYLHSTPDDIYACTIYYKKKPAVLSADDDVTILGKEWDEAILKLGVVDGLAKLKRYEESAIEKKSWQQLMYGLLGMYDKERRDREEQLRINVRDRNYKF